jgi:prepilin-type N-terminal cleavage/methylation domain-containing protein
MAGTGVALKPRAARGGPGRRERWHALGQHAGFTLIELLVVLAIVTVLFGLILSAIQAGRSAALRTGCANRLHQIGVAFGQHHDAFGVFPSNGGWDGSQTIKATDGSEVQVYTWDLTMTSPYHWGVGAPGLAPQAQTGCWAYSLLPYLEQGPRYQARDWTSPIDLYICPARRGPLAQPAVNDAHAVYSGGGWTWGKIDYAANYLVVPNRPDCLSTASIRDGTSMTILAGEKAMSPTNYANGTWFWDEPFFTGGSDSTARKGNQVLVDTRTMDQDLSFRENWGSAHPGGAHFLFSDLSARFLGFSVPRATMQALLTPGGAEVVAGY